MNGSCKANGIAKPRKGAASRYCKPDLSCWPTPAEWRELGSKLTGKLEKPRSLLLPCEVGATGAACAAAIRNLKNPFYVEDDPGGTHSVGWLGAWNSTASAYSVAAETPEDVVAAVNFARRHQLRLVVKSTGHDFLGRSNAPDSLLVWMHKMRQIAMRDVFVPRGCPATQVGSPAVTLGSGVRWIEAYQEVTGKHGRYVQGGACTSIGAAGGFIQGGGFGSFSKKFGTAAANMLEADVVTADGRLLTANACQNQDLFWALRGGGGGTYGIVTSVTLRTHPLPKRFGLLQGSIAAKTDDAFKELLERFLSFYRENLNNEHWGEVVKVRGDNSLELDLVFQGMDAKEAERVWRPLRAWIERRPSSFTMRSEYIDVLGDKMWDVDYLNRRFPGALETDKRAGQPAGRFWWEGHFPAYWYTFQSRWIPLDRFDGAAAKAFAQSLFEASRYWTLDIPIYKGQSGASVEALRRDRETSMNPAVYQAAALVIIPAGADAYPGVRGLEPNLVEGEAVKARASAAMNIIRKATPGAGAYVNEADYFEPDWQRTFWGENYPKLLAIKRKYDPDGMFYCHHCVGSEEGP